MRGMKRYQSIDVARLKGVCGDNVGIMLQALKAVQAALAEGMSAPVPSDGVCGWLYDWLESTYPYRGYDDLSFDAVEAATGMMYPIDDWWSFQHWEGEQRQARVELVNELIEALS